MVCTKLSSYKKLVHKQVLALPALCKSQAARHVTVLLGHRCKKQQIMLNQDVQEGDM